MKYLLNGFSLSMLRNQQTGTVTFWTKIKAPSREEMGQMVNALNIRHSSTCAVAEALGANPTPAVAPLVALVMGDRFVVMTPRVADRSGMERDLTAGDFTWVEGVVSVCM